MEGLTINYKGEELELSVKAYPYGYTYRLEVTLVSEVIIFEPDEEGSYRAFASEKMDKVLIAIIAAELERSRL